MSLHNILSVTVTELSADSATDTVVVQLAMGNSRLLAEVTRDAVERLAIAPGARLQALIKAVSLELRAVGPPAPVQPSRDFQPPQRPFHDAQRATTVPRNIPFRSVKAISPDAGVKRTSTSSLNGKARRILSVGTPLPFHRRLDGPPEGDVHRHASASSAPRARIAGCDDDLERLFVRCGGRDDRRARLPRREELPATATGAGLRRATT